MIYLHKARRSDFLSDRSGHGSSSGILSIMSEIYDWWNSRLVLFKESHFCSFAVSNPSRYQQFRNVKFDDSLIFCLLFLFHFTFLVLFLFTLNPYLNCWFPHGYVSIINLQIFPPNIMTEVLSTFQAQKVIQEILYFSAQCTTKLNDMFGRRKMRGNKKKTEDVL